MVARRVRAWIETASGAANQGTPIVARRVRAWIETSRPATPSGRTLGRPPRAGVD